MSARTPASCAWPLSPPRAAGAVLRHLPILARSHKRLGTAQLAEDHRHELRSRAEPLRSPIRSVPVGELLELSTRNELENLMKNAANHCTAGHLRVSSFDNPILRGLGGSTSLSLYTCFGQVWCQHLHLDASLIRRANHSSLYRNSILHRRDIECVARYFGPLRFRNAARHEEPRGAAVERDVPEPQWIGGQGLWWRIRRQGAW